MMREARGSELGYCTRKAASAAVAARAQPFSSVGRSTEGCGSTEKPSSSSCMAYTEVCLTPGRTVRSSLQASTKGASLGSTAATDRTF